jgi:hypothetical protein
MTFGCHVCFVATRPPRDPPAPRNIIPRGKLTFAGARPFAPSIRAAGLVLSSTDVGPASPSPPQRASHASPASQPAAEHCRNHAFVAPKIGAVPVAGREAADAIAVQRALSGKDKLRGFKAFRYGAKSWDKERRFVARIEATPKGLDVRYVVTTLKAGARHLYETLYCARGNAENFIKLHKSQLASDRTSCRDPKANQFRLILHTAAYWLMLGMRNAAPKRSPVSTVEFATIRVRLIKIAARVVEGAARFRVFLPTVCADRDVFRALAGRFCAPGP